MLELCDGERSLDDIVGASPRATRADVRDDVVELVDAMAQRGLVVDAPRPSTLIAELSYQCPLHCPYCSNPLDIGGEHARRELETEHWIRAFGEARRLGVLQLALTGGEPMLRRDLVELCAGARDAGLYSSLITAGTLFTRDRAQALKAAGLDHVQISIQSPDPEDNDRIAGNRSFEIAAARHAKGSTSADDQLRPAPAEPRSHRGACSISRSISARSGSSSPTRSTTAGRSRTRTRSCRRGAARARRGAVERFRERVGPKVDVLWVLPTSTRSCRSRAWAAGAGRRWWSLRTAT